MRQPEHPPAARVQAANILLDRGWGKPPQAHTGEDGRGQHPRGHPPHRRGSRCATCHRCCTDRGGRREMTMPQRFLASTLRTRRERCASNHCAAGSSPVRDRPTTTTTHENMSIDAALRMREGRALSEAIPQPPRPRQCRGRSLPKADRLAPQRSWRSSASSSSPCILSFNRPNGEHVKVNWYPSFGPQLGGRLFSRFQFTPIAATPTTGAPAPVRKPVVLADQMVAPPVALAALPARGAAGAGRVAA